MVTSGFGFPSGHRGSLLCFQHLRTLRLRIFLGVRGAHLAIRWRRGDGEVSVPGDTAICRFTQAGKQREWGCKNHAAVLAKMVPADAGSGIL